MPEYSNLYDFAYLPKSWLDMLSYLEDVAIKENWAFKNSDPTKPNQKNPILENYILHTFKRLMDERSSNPQEENLRFFISETEACFNTGLFTKNYKEIYAYFEINKVKISSIKAPWVFKGFYDDSSSNLSNIYPLPIRAQYFQDISDLIYNTKLELRVNSDHILGNPSNKNRIPDNVRDVPNLSVIFDAAILLAKKKIQANYKVAVPQYYESKIQFLIPICLQNMETVDLALAVTKQNMFYTGYTCLTMDMAYNNARLIAKPDSEWLKP